MSFYLKDPQSRVDYGIDWGAGYLAGQTIAGSAWSVEPQEAGGIVIDAAAFDSTRTAATLTGGVAGRVYSVSNHITLSDGRSDDRSISLRVEQR
ncbi:MAG TPA: hypothetical protein VGX37_05400 [Allosphingosinicella sp.]|jgi:hypothetical protein|nr:hypothetical protein [Allosphingosinicella sp.]